MAKRGSKEKRLALATGRSCLHRLEKMISHNILQIHLLHWRVLCIEASRHLQRKLNVMSYRTAMRMSLRFHLRLFAEWRDICFVRQRQIPPPPGLTMLKPKTWQ